MYTGVHQSVRICMKKTCPTKLFSKFLSLKRNIGNCSQWYKSMVYAMQPHTLQRERLRRGRRRNKKNSIYCSYAYTSIQIVSMLPESIRTITIKKTPQDRFLEFHSHCHEHDCRCYVVRVPNVRC